MRTTCRRRPFALNRRSVKRSPFRTLDRAVAAEKANARGASIGFTARSSLKSMGRIPRKDGCYVLGKKYK
jgi:hypothetical protein